MPSPEQTAVDGVAEGCLASARFLDSCDGLTDLSGDVVNGDLIAERLRSAAETIARLTSERDLATREVERLTAYEAAYRGTVSEIDTLRTEVRRLTRERDEVRKALAGESPLSELVHDDDACRCLPCRLSSVSDARHRAIRERDEARAGVVHLSTIPFRPICGADENGQHTTDAVAFASCVACLRARTVAMSEVLSSADLVIEKARRAWDVSDTYAAIQDYDDTRHRVGMGRKAKGGT